jgi:ATP-dependent helicase/nuclease subunit A
MNVENVLARVRLTYSTDAENETISFHEAIRKYANDQTDETSRLLKEMLDKLAEWRDIARRKPLADLIWHIYDQTGYLAYVSGLDDGNQRVANLLSLHQRARQFGEFLRQGLHRFMGFLNELREETDLAQPSVAGDTGRAVRILSIHAAKGLEFPVVLLPDLGKKFNMSDARGLVLTDRRMGLAMQVVDLPRQIHYPSLSSTLLVADLRKQTLAEEIRLLYVALTRAESRIVLIGTAPDGAVDKWANKFRSVKGAFPPEIVLSANSMLDWLGPMQAACGDATCKLFAYSAEQVHAWSGANKQKATDETNRLVRIAELAPLKAQVAPSFAANEIISRLEFSYPHQEFTQLAAAAAATSVGSGHFAGTSRIELQPPSSLSEQVGMSATQIGDATHKVLEHLDYLRPCDESGVREQVSQLVGRGLLTAEQANVVDVASIVWLASTPLGQLLKTHSKQLRREVAFATALGDAPISMDSVMVRGRIDLLLPMDGGVALVDYKTDRVTETGVKDRAETYLSQMGVYRDALRKIAKKEVKAIYLVFLAPRIIWKAE